VFKFLLVLSGMAGLAVMLFVVVLVIREGRPKTQYQIDESLRSHELRL
jgi:hypothetical protein